MFENTLKVNDKELKLYSIRTMVGDHSDVGSHYFIDDSNDESIPVPSDLLEKSHIVADYTGCRVTVEATYDGEIRGRQRQITVSSVIKPSWWR